MANQLVFYDDTAQGWERASTPSWASHECAMGDAAGQAGQRKPMKGSPTRRHRGAGGHIGPPLHIFFQPQFDAAGMGREALGAGDQRRRRADRA